MWRLRSKRSSASSPRVTADVGGTQGRVDPEYRTHGLPKGSSSAEPANTTSVMAEFYRCRCGFQFSLELGKFGCANCCGDDTAEFVEETALDVFMRAIAGNPWFVEAKPSGRAFVITGARPPTQSSCQFV